MAHAIALAILSVRLDTNATSKNASAEQQLAQWEASPMEEQSLSEQAVTHARLAERAAELSWKHIWAEYTQDPVQIAATLASDAPIAWTLARQSAADGGAYRFLTGTTIDEVRGQYETLRQELEIHGWEPLLEIRSSWYTMWQGASNIRVVATGSKHKGQTVVLFPVGRDGILGELQIATVGRMPDGTAPTDEERVPTRRLAVLHDHEAHLDALRAGDVQRIMSAYRDDAAVAIRDYRSDPSSLLNVGGTEAITSYYLELFRRFRVIDIQVINRAIDTWYFFAELHCLVEERETGRQREFCTADLTSIDPDRKYWVQTGAGTDPVDGRGPATIGSDIGAKAFAA
jgi:ketosteroid isomerase-like protein